jgi:hypothetical protein
MNRTGSEESEVDWPWWLTLSWDKSSKEGPK